MKEEEIDRILKNRMYNELRAPEKLKRRISYEIKNININSNKNMYSKLRLIKSMAAIAVFSILGITTFQIFNEKIQKEENLRTQVLASYNGESGKNIPDGKLGSEELKAIGDFIKLQENIGFITSEYTNIANADWKKIFLGICDNMSESGLWVEKEYKKLINDKTTDILEHSVYKVRRARFIKYMKRIAKIEGYEDLIDNKLKEYFKYSEEKDAYYVLGGNTPYYEVNVVEGYKKDNYYTIKGKFKDMKDISGEECEFEVKLLNDKQMLQFESNKIDKIKTPENMNTISQNTSIENQKPESSQEEENKYITLTEEIWDDMMAYPSVDKYGNKKYQFVVNHMVKEQEDVYIRGAIYEFVRTEENIQGIICKIKNEKPYYQIKLTKDSIIQIKCTNDGEYTLKKFCEECHYLFRDERIEDYEEIRQINPTTGDDLIFKNDVCIRFNYDGR